MIWITSFTTVGTDYATLILSELRRPGTYVKKALHTIYLRFGLFYSGFDCCWCHGAVRPFMSWELNCSTERTGQADRGVGVERPIVDRYGYSTLRRRRILGEV